MPRHTCPARSRRRRIALAGIVAALFAWTPAEADGAGQVCVGGPGDRAAIEARVRELPLTGTDELAGCGQLAVEPLVAALLDRGSRPQRAFAVASTLDRIKPRSEEAAARVILALAAELDPLPDLGEDREGAPADMLDPEQLTRIDALLVATGAFGQLATPALPLLGRVEARARPSTRLRARNAIAQTSDAAAIAIHIEDLGVGGAAARRAIDGLERMGPRARAAVPALTPHLRLGMGPEVASALGAIGDPLAVEPLTHALAVRDFRTNAASARALLRLGAPARPSVPALDRLAATHWSPAVREAAAEAASGLSGTPRLATPVPLRGEAGDGYLVWTARGPVSMARLGWSGKDAFGPANGGPGPEHDRHDPACIAVAREVHAWVSVRVDRDCVLGIGRGEWGGSLLVASASGGTPPVEVAALGNVRALVRRGDRVFVLQGLSHLGGTSGSVAVARQTSRGWSVEPLVRLPGDVLAVSGHGDGLVVVALEEVPGTERRVASAFVMTPEGDLARAARLGFSAVTLLTVPCLLPLAWGLRRAWRTRKRAGSQRPVG